MALIAVADAKIALRITSADYDAELAIKAPQASAIVLDYITTAEADLTGDALLVAQAAAYDVAQALLDGADPLSADVKNILRRLRDPSVA